MKYRGESIGKKFARAALSPMIAHEMRGRPNPRAMYLASGVGGDVSLMESAGIPRANHVAVDVDKDAAEQFIGKFPDVPFFLGDVSGVAESQGPTDVIYLDFCGNLGPQLLETARRVLAASSMEGGLFIVAMMRGRERPKSFKWIESRRRAQAIRDEMRKRKLRNGSFSNQDVQASWFLAARDMVESEGDCSAANHSARSAAVHAELQNVLVRDRIVLTPLQTSVYQSNGEDSCGTPMMVESFRISKYPKWFPVGSFIRKTRKGGSVQSYDWTECTAEDMAIAISKSPEPPEVVAKMFNISIETAAAYKAHYTRGTYKTGDDDRLMNAFEVRAEILSFIANDNPSKEDVEHLEVFKRVQAVCLFTLQKFGRLRPFHMRQMMEHALCVQLAEALGSTKNETVVRSYAKRILEIWTGCSLDEIEETSGAQTVCRVSAGIEGRSWMKASGVRLRV